MINTVSPNNPNEPYNVVMQVTPEMALKWLEGNTHNRPISQAHVDRLAGDIIAGRWRLTHQGIAFDTEGLLADGQHRLWAVVEAGIPVMMRVFFNEPPENRQVLDSGERRSNLDILTLTEQVGEVSAQHLATLRAILAGQTSKVIRVTPGKEAEHYAKHREAIDFAVKHLSACRVSGVGTAQVRAVIARAYYSADHGRLAHFCDVMKSGMAADDGDHCIIMLWNFLVRTRDAGRGQSVRRLRYAKTEWALSRFLQGRQVARLGSSDTELFPLPEELDQKATA